MGFKIAVAGATGNVGREMLNILSERGFPADEVVALASARSQGTEVSFGDRTLNCLYYDVPPEYATPTRPAYDARGGLTASRLGASISRALGADLRLALHAGVETVGVSR